MPRVAEASNSATVSPIYRHSSSIQIVAFGTRRTIRAAGLIATAEV